MSRLVEPVRTEQGLAEALHCDEPTVDDVLGDARGRVRVERRLHRDTFPWCCARRWSSSAA